MTKRELIDDILLRYEGKPSDDFQMYPKQVEAWVNMVWNDVMREWINNDMGGDVPGSLWHQIDCIAAKKDDGCVGASACQHGAGQYYLELIDKNGQAIKILDLPEEGGIRLYKGDVEMKRYGNVSSVSVLRKLPGVGVETLNGWYRAGDRIWLVMNRSPMSFEQFNLWFVLGGVSGFSMDDDLGVPDEIIGRISTKIEPIGWRQLSGVNDLVNDGKSGAA